MLNLCHLCGENTHLFQSCGHCRPLQGRLSKPACFLLLFLLRAVRYTHGKHDIGLMDVGENMNHLTERDIRYQVRTRNATSLIWTYKYILLPQTERSLCPVTFPEICASWYTTSLCVYSRRGQTPGPCSVAPTYLPRVLQMNTGKISTRKFI